jgi:hypothetical protein
MNPDYAHWRAVMLDSIGRYRSKSLFWELRKIERSDVYEPLFTTKDKPHTVPTFDKKGLITYPSLKQLYLSYDHVPGHEYEFAMDVFGSWDHWNHLHQSSLKGMLQGWRDELTVKLKAEAIKKMIAASKENSAVGINAARYLADEGYLPKKVGRITKEEKLREIKLAAGVRDDLATDMERLGMTIIQGSKQ